MGHLCGVEAVTRLRFRLGVWGGLIIYFRLLTSSFMAGPELGAVVLCRQGRDHEPRTLSYVAGDCISKQAAYFVQDILPTMGAATHENWVQSLSRSMGLCRRVNVVLTAEPRFNASVPLGVQRAASTRTNVSTSVLQDMPTSRLRVVRSHSIVLASWMSDDVALAHANSPA